MPTKTRIPKLVVTKMRRIPSSVDIVIVGDEEVVFLEERSKSFAYGGANHQPQACHEKHFEDLRSSHRHWTWLDLTLLITDGTGMCSAQTDMV